MALDRSAVRTLVRLDTIGQLTRHTPFSQGFLAVCSRMSHNKTFWSPALELTNRSRITSQPLTTEQYSMVWYLDEQCHFDGGNTRQRQLILRLGLPPVLTASSHAYEDSWKVCHQSNIREWDRYAVRRRKIHRGWLYSGCYRKTAVWSLLQSAFPFCTPWWWIYISSWWPQSSQSSGA